MIFQFLRTYNLSSSYVTDGNGETTQFFLNLPFGETMAEQNLPGAYENPYKFNAKELDVETGLYYYGARYYNPRLSIWYGVDPLAEKYPSLAPYVYVANNPVNAIDPDGRYIIFVTKDNTALHYKNGSFYYLNGKLTGQRYNASRESVSVTLARIERAYRKIEKSNDKVLKGILHHLEKSENGHVIREGVTNDVFINRKLTKNNSGGDGTKTRHNFDGNLKQEFQESEGVPNSDLSIVVHEMRHQFDYDIGNAFDGKYEDKQTARDPNEQRAVKEENRARDLEGLEKRTTYGKDKVNPNPSNYKLPKNIK